MRRRDLALQRTVRPAGLAIWIAAAWIAIVILPFNAIGGRGFLAFDWLRSWPGDVRVAPALVQLVIHHRLWLLPLPIVAALATLIAWRTRDSLQGGARALIGCGIAGVASVAALAFAIDIGGWTSPALAAVFGPLSGRQSGLGYGALLFSIASLMVFAHGLALRGWVRGDAFVAGTLTLAVASIGLFTLYPLWRLLIRAFVDNDGYWSLAALGSRIVASRVWGIGGVVWNTVELGLLTATSATVLALSLALLITRTRLPAKRLVGVLAVLPMITPPFVIGLALIMLFGRSGALNAVLEWAFGVPPSRWIYGLPGVWLAQTLALTPVAYLVLAGVVDGISPAFEEAAATLRASRFAAFRTVALPLMTPGLVNAFLVVFIESLADFGNPLLLGGNLEVLSVSIYFAIVGVQQDPGRAAVLAIILLLLSLSVFAVQRRWIAGRGFVTLSGKGVTERRPPVPQSVAIAAAMFALPFIVLTAIVYAMIFSGGFFEKWGLNHAFTLRHYATAFGAELSGGGLQLTGGAWSSFVTTLTIAAVSAPLTAAFGLLVAWLIDRQRFALRRAFEFVAMLSFAMPGTVVGIAYILAFNAPPIELAYSGLILVACFVFRDMTTSLRAGLAALAQVDPALDEASSTMRAGALATLRRVVVPLTRPAIVAALVYSFVSAMTSVSAVIFLTSPRFDMATVNIVGRAEVGEYGYASAYATVLIAVMVAAVIAIRLIVGKRKTGGA